MIVWADNREDAIKRMRRALSAYKLFGVKTSIPFLKKVMVTPDFVNGNYSTHFIEKNKDILHSDTNATEEESDLAAITAFLDFMNQQEKASQSASVSGQRNYWKEFGRRKGALRL